MKFNLYKIIKMKKIILSAILFTGLIVSAQLANNNLVRVGICRTEYMGTTTIKYGTGADGKYYRIITYSMRDENGLQRTKTAVLVLNESPCN